ncbi:phosphohydrolase [Corynebacterium hadale]|nr:phosphohydrolase [Corynebacterium hadale]
MAFMRTPHRSPARRGALAAALAVSLFAAPVAVPTAHAATNAVDRVALGIGADETQANVAWQSARLGEQYLEYWKSDDPSSKQSVTSEKGPREALITNLEPETEYTYRIGSDKIGWTDEATFTTGEESDSWNFLAFADAQIGVDTKIDEQAAAWDKAVTTATSEHPDSAFIMHLGDQIEGWGAPNQQMKAFLAPEKLKEYRLAVLRGNHETYAPASIFDDGFYLPNEDADTTDYFFTYNNVLFIGLDGNRSSSEDIQKHAEFVKKTIAEQGKDADWVIAGIHQAPFSQGTHYTDNDVVRMRNELTPELSSAGVDLVLSGHDHIYTRTHLMNGADPVVPESAAKAGDVLIPDENQVLYVTSTTATGGKYYDFQDENKEKHPRIREERATDLVHKSTARWRQDYNPDYTSIDVSPESLKLTTYNINTPYTVDQVTLQKKDAAKPEETTTPAKPSEATTSATSAQATPTTGKTSPAETTTATTTVRQEPKTSVVTTTVEKPVTTTQTVDKTTEVPTTITKGSPAPTTVTTAVPTTVREEVAKTTTKLVPTTITRTEEVASTAKETVKETVEKTVATTANATVTTTAEPTEKPDQQPSEKPSDDTEGASSGSSVAGAVLLALGLFASLLAVIAGIFAHQYPDLVQQIRNYFNI